MRTVRLTACVIATLGALWVTVAAERPSGVNRDGKVFVHPGLTYTQGDIDRMKAMIAAGREPWAGSFAALKASRYANPSQNVHGRGGTIPEGGFNNSIGIDGRCAHDLALMWRLTGDVRYAETARRILVENAKWEGASNSGTGPLDNGKIVLLVEAAELMRDYSGWTADEREKFAGTLRTVFYPNIKNGDASRWGNQGLMAFRGVLAMAVFLDDVKMYDRVWNYLLGLAHRPDDEPYVSGRSWCPDWPADYGEYCISRTGGIHREDTPDWGYDELLQYYIYRNGQCEESCRDQNHTKFGLMNYVCLAETFWNQGEDLYGALDSRILLGLEWTLRYNLGDWEPTGYEDDEANVSFANGRFYKAKTRTGRWTALKPSPDGRGAMGNASGPVTCALMHYRTRVGLPAERSSWLQRQWDMIHADGGCEIWGAEGHHYEWTGWGTLAKFRTEWMRGDPVTWRDGVRVSGLHPVPGTVKASDWDFMPPGAEDRTSHHAVEGRWSAGDWALYTLAGAETETWRNVTVVYRSDADAEVSFSCDGQSPVTGRLPSTGGQRGETVAGVVRIPPGAGVFRLELTKGEGVRLIALGFGDTLKVGEPTATPGLDYRGNTVSVPIGELLCGTDGDIAATLSVGGSELVGTVDRAAGSVTFLLEPSFAESGTVRTATVAVTVDGAVSRRTFEIVQGQEVRSGRTGWIRESVGSVGATGTWSVKPETEGGRLRLVVEGETSFTPRRSMADGSTATLTLTAVPGVNEKVDFDDGVKAGVAVVRVDGVNRYVFATADGPVTNLAAVACDYGQTTVQVTLDYGAGTAVYRIDGAEFGPYRLDCTEGRLKSVDIAGLAFLTGLSGDYASVSADASLAEIEGQGYPTVAAAAESGKTGTIRLLWDASWAPTNGQVRTLEMSGHRLVMGGETVWRMDENADGTVTLTVLGEESRPTAATVRIEDGRMTVGVLEARSGFQYGLAVGPSPSGPFTPIADSWRSGDDLMSGQSLSCELDPSATAAFYKVIVRSPSPPKVG